MQFAPTRLITLLTNISVHSQKGQKSAENDPLHLQRRRGSCHQAIDWRTVTIIAALITIFSHHFCHFVWTEEVGFQIASTPFKNWYFCRVYSDVTKNVEECMKRFDKTKEKIDTP